MKLTFLCILFVIGTVSINAQCWQFIEAGGSSSFGIKDDNTLWAWGYNLWGQLGDGTVIHKIVPVKIGTDSNWKSVSASDHTLAIKTDGTLWGWGRNVFGQVGDGTNTDKHVPTQIGAGNNWKEVSAGTGHSLAIKTDGTLWAWGANGQGQHGDGTFTNKDIPAQIGTDTNWQSVSGGNEHTLAIKSNGTLWAWGGNAKGQLGDGTFIATSLPVQIGMATNWKNVSACIEVLNSGYSSGIRQDGSIWTWGWNYYGQLGDGTNIDKNVPTQIGAGNSWLSISAGDLHVHAIKQDGTLWGWGWNVFGQLGDGTAVDKNIPVQVGNSNSWQKISDAGAHNLAIKTDNSLWAWGYNFMGQLGDSTVIDKNTPTYINGGNNCLPTFISTNSESVTTLSVYPNPAATILNFRCAIANNKDKPYNYQIRNTVGQLIQAGIANTDNSLYIGNLSKGIYFINFESRDVTSAAKLKFVKD